MNRLAAADARLMPRSYAGTVGLAAGAILVSYLPFSAVTGVLGEVARSLDASTQGLTGVTDAFSGALILGLLVGGPCGARFGARLVTLVCLGVVVAAALGGLAVDSLPALWTVQGVLGLAAGAIMSTSFALVAVTAPRPEARTRGIGIWAAANVVGLGAGPFLAAAASAAGWRGLYLPIAGLAVLVAAFGAVAALETPRSRRMAAPVDLRMLLAPRFTAAGLAAGFMLLAVIGVVFTLSVTLGHHGVSQVGIAERVGFLYLGNVAASIASGPLQIRFGTPPVLLAGLAMAVTGLVVLAGAGSQLADQAWRLALVGLAAGTVVSCCASLAVQSVEPTAAARAGTGNNVMRQLGAVMGPLLVGTLRPSTAALLLALLLATVSAIVAVLLTNRLRRSARPITPANPATSAAR